VLAPIEVRCDRCGVSGREQYTFCPRCSLYVCDACWDAAGDACLSCLRPGLPVGATLPSAIRTTVGSAGIGHVHAGPHTSRVSRSLAANAARRQAAESVPLPPTIPIRPGVRRTPAPAPTPVPPAAPPRSRPRPRIDAGSTARILLMSAALAAALLILPAIFDRDVPATAPPVGPTARAEATPDQDVRSGRSNGASRFTTYVVRQGDTLRGIAARVYGNPERWRRIFHANRRLLDSPNDLVPGMELRIPRAD
jgi:nucleoid-associated protein YgaU